MRLRKLKRERAVDGVYQALRQGILGSLMRPGERINVEDLSEKLGVSLTPVRHALQQLATEGLVEIRPRSGTFVASLDARDIEETFDIRWALECLAAEKAVENVTPRDLERFKELLKSLRRPVRLEEDRKNHERDNSELHRLLIRLSGNQRLAEMYEALHAHMKIARIHQSERDWPSRLADEQAEHERIVVALERRSRHDLIQALRAHIDRAKDALLAGMQTPVER